LSATRDNSTNVMVQNHYQHARNRSCTVSIQLFGAVWSVYRKRSG